MLCCAARCNCRSSNRFLLPSFPPRQVCFFASHLGFSRSVLRSGFDLTYILEMSAVAMWMEMARTSNTIGSNFAVGRLISWSFGSSTPVVQVVCLLCLRVFVMFYVGSTPVLPAGWVVVASDGYGKGDGLSCVGSELILPTSGRVLRRTCPRR